MNIVSQSTHQPTPQERRAGYEQKKIYVPELNPAYNIFSKRFDQEFQSIFGETK